MQQLAAIRSDDYSLTHQEKGRKPTGANVDAGSFGSDVSKRTTRFLSGLVFIVRRRGM